MSDPFENITPKGLLHLRMMKIALYPLSRHLGASKNSLKTKINPKHSEEISHVHYVQDLVPSIVVMSHDSQTS